MAAKGDAPPSPGTVRLVARVVDPSAREDGVNEPVLELASERGAKPVAGAPLLPSAAPERLVRGLAFNGHPVRDRLLSRALAAESEAAQATAAAGRKAAEADQMRVAAERAAAERAEALAAPHVPEFSSLPPLADDLDLIGARRRPEPTEPSPIAPLAPLTALLLGTLFGVAALGALFAVLIHVAPRGVIARAPEAPAAAPESAPAQANANAGLDYGWIRRPSRKPQNMPWRIEQEQDPELSRLMASIGARSFLDAAREAGLSVGEGFRAMAALKGEKNLDKCRPSDVFIALVARATGKLHAFEYVVSPEEVYQAREGPDGLLHGARLNLKAERLRVLGAVQVRTSFEDSARQVGFESGLASIVDRALEGYAKTSEMAAGDSVRMVVQELSLLGTFSRYTGIEAVEYRPRRGEPIRLYYLSGKDVRGYVDAKGRRFGRGRWTNPVKDVRITSRFNPKRFHPILKRTRPHNGTDFAAAIGTPVLAADSGVVSFMGAAGPNGNLLKIDHAGGYETGYSHLSRFAKGLKRGARVSQRQVVGFSGSTGRSTGPHLHFSAKKNGRFIDPETLRLDEFTRLPAADRDLMTDLRQRYDQLLETVPLPRPFPVEPAPLLEVVANEGPNEDDEEGEGQGAVPSAASATLASTAESRMNAAATAVVASEPVVARPEPIAPPTPAAAPSASAASVILPAPGTPASPDQSPQENRASLSIFLSDGELLRRQPATHSGEVEP